VSDRHPDIYNEFDIEEARKAAKAFERERIINLLTEFDDSHLWRQVEFNPDAYEGFNIQEIIDIIARTHENEPNPRFADTEILEIRTNARKENN
jgi:hypothetical protein